jgi:hypothetical protein
LEPKGHETAALEHLAPGKTYHYRVIAFNAQSPSGTPGEDKTFTTQLAPAEPAETCPNAKLRAEQPYGKKLPDCRAYELVSPENTGGQDATTAAGFTRPRAAVSGEAVTYVSRGALGEPAGATVENQELSRRNAEGDRWETQPITPLHEPLTTEAERSYWANAFTPELNEGIATTNYPLVEGAPGGKKEGEFGLYVDDFAHHSYAYVGPTDRTDGTSSDLSHVVFTTETPHEQAAHQYASEWVEGTVFPVTVNNNSELFEGTVGDEHNTCPSRPDEHETWHAVSSNGKRVYFTSPGCTSEHQPNEQSGPGSVYVRENPEAQQSPMLGEECLDLSDACTVDVSASQKTNGAGPGGTDVNGLRTARYWGASADGSKVFFTSPEELTNDANTGISDRQEVVVSPGTSGGTFTLSFKGQSTAALAYDASRAEVQSALQALSTIEPGNVAVTGSNGNYLVTFQGALAAGEQPALTDDASLLVSGNISITSLQRPGRDLYEYELSGEAGKPGKLTDLTADAAGDGAKVLGVSQISEDGSYVYFIAEGVLAEHATANAPNLYVSHEGGAPVFIATLSRADSSDGIVNENETKPGPADTTAVVSPSGSRLAFMSSASLTGYDNVAANNTNCGLNQHGKPEPLLCPEIFEYDAVTNRLVCASCDPSGARPTGPSSLGEEALSVDLYRARNLLDDGSLFFDSADGLVPDAAAGIQNVYEYEEGHVYAISNVAGREESFFMDVGADGRDVFFASADQLLPQHAGETVAVWDARVDGGFPAPVAPAPCESADACKPPAGGPSVSTAVPSRALTGPGNPAPPPPTLVKPKSAEQLRVERLAKALKTCRTKKNRHKRAICEKTARKRYAKKASAKKSAKRATTDRRATR